MYCNVEMTLLNTLSPFQVQSFNQYKYLYACVASYAKEIEDQKNNDEEDIYVNTEHHKREPEDIYVFIP